MKRSVLLLIAGECLFGDTIGMKNGDRLTGTIVTSSDKGVVIKTEFAGEVTVGWPAITEVTTKEPVTLTLKDGKSITGVVRTVEGKFETTPATPQFLDMYTGFADFGLALSRGNASTTTFNTVANLNRITANDKVTLRFAQIYASNSTLGPGVATAQAVRGGVGYQRNISKKWFVNAFNDYEFDRFQLLDLRFVLGSGVGYQAIKNERTLLTFGGGGAYNREKFASDGTRAAFTRSSAEAYFNQEFTHKLNSRLNIFERFAFFPNLSNTGEYRLQFDSGLAAALYKSLSLQIAFSDRYLSNPPVGRKRNDTLLTTGVRYTIPTRVKQ